MKATILARVSRIWGLHATLQEIFSSSRVLLPGFYVLQCIGVILFTLSEFD